MLRSRRIPNSLLKRLFSLSQIPTIGTVPILGSALLFRRVHWTKDGREFLPAESLLDASSTWYGKHGAVYTMGLPGFGDGIRQIYVVCCDPREYTKVMQNEGRNPFGALLLQWPISAALKDLNSPVAKLWTQGEDWRRMRMASQKALVTPDAIKGYIPGVCKAAALASENFDQFHDRLYTFNCWTAFDMIFTAIFGRLLDSSREGDERTTQYTKTVTELTDDLLALLVSPYEGLMKSLGITTSGVKKITKMIKSQNAMSDMIVEEFLAKRERGELDEYELGSYVSVNLSRQEQVEDGLTLQEFKELIPVFLGAGVDTTSSVLNWVQLFLALNPEVQTKVREEVLNCVTVKGSSQDLVEFLARPKKYLPYLNMVIREAHRLRPPFASSINKRPEKEIELGGYTIPAGTLCKLDGYAIQNDPRIVADSEKFIPERWSPEAIEARKNTPAEVLDHPLIRGPFSAGARMCPGNRVAQLEVITMIATLVRHWEFTIAPGQGISDYRDIKYFQGLTIQPRPMPMLCMKKLTG